LLGGCDIDNTYAYGEGLEGLQTLDTESTIYIQPVDSLDLNFTSADLTFVVSILGTDGPQSIPAEVQYDETDGRYIVTYTPRLPGTYAITITSPNCGRGGLVRPTPTEIFVLGTSLFKCLIG
jgi:hypothetical protein